MPCSSCGTLLLVNHTTDKLVCPNCADIPVENQEVIDEKIEAGLDYFRDERLLQILEDYSKENVLLYLMERLNKISYDFFETRRLAHREFAYLNYVMRIVYPESGFGDKYLDRGEELDETIDALLMAQSELIQNLRHARDGFKYCVHRPIPDDQPFFGEYHLFSTEYRWAYTRCFRSLIGGWEDDVDLFDRVHGEFREFNTPDGSMFESLENFFGIAYKFIVSLIFVASADEVVGDVYTTFLPEEVSVLDIHDFLTAVNSKFENPEGYLVLQDSTLGWSSREEVDSIGERIFEDIWPDMREKLIVSEDNLDAHPFLFEIPFEEIVKEVPGRPPITRSTHRIVYPRFYDILLLFQISPLLQNGEHPSGHEFLETETTRRGEVFEKRVFEYFVSQGFECYYSSRIEGSDREEIDVIVVNSEEDEVWFLEAKYILPETDMNTSEGIERMNEKFDFKVFNEGSAYPGEPTGDPFPEKVEVWMNSGPDTNFTCRMSSELNEGGVYRYPVEWNDFHTRLMVVSNMVPSYVVKQGVQFLTDMELIELVENGKELYDVRY